MKNVTLNTSKQIYDHFRFLKPLPVILLHYLIKGDLEKLEPGFTRHFIVKINNLNCLSSSQIHLAAK